MARVSCVLGRRADLRQSLVGLLSEQRVAFAADATRTGSSVAVIYAPVRLEPAIKVIISYEVSGRQINFKWPVI